MQTYNKRKYFQNKKMSQKANKIKKARWRWGSSQPTRQSRRSCVLSWAASLQPEQRRTQWDTRRAATILVSGYQGSWATVRFSRTKGSIRLGRHIPLTLGKFDILFPRQVSGPRDVARESPTQRPVSHLVSTPWSAPQSCFSVPTAWCSLCSFTDIWSGTDDIRCLRTLKPTPCVSLDPFCPVSFTHLSLNLIRLVKFSMQHIRQNAPAMN